MSQMDQKERLVGLIVAAPTIDIPVGSRAQGKTYRTALTIADYLLANGVMVPPCKLGQSGYWVTKSGIMVVTFDRIFLSTGDVWKVRARYQCTETVYFTLEHFGKIVFNTFEEAEKAYAERIGS